MGEIENNVLADDVYFMREAINEAIEAEKKDEVPVGAVIVKDGNIIARTHNLVETNRSSYAHAEMLAIESAESALGSKWLTGCTLYVTLEPCAMCAGAMVLARIDRLCFGATDPKNGACTSIFNVTCNDALNHKIEVTSGVCEEECSRLLSDFFRKKRREKSKLKTNRIQTQ